MESPLPPAKNHPPSVRSGRAGEDPTIRGRGQRHSAAGGPSADGSARPRARGVGRAGAHCRRGPAAAAGRPARDAARTIPRRRGAPARGLHVRGGESGRESARTISPLSQQRPAVLGGLHAHRLRGTVYFPIASRLFRSARMMDVRRPARPDPGRMQTATCVDSSNGEAGEGRGGREDPMLTVAIRLAGRP